MEEIDLKKLYKQLREKLDEAKIQKKDLIEKAGVGQNALNPSIAYKRNTITSYNKLVRAFNELTNEK